MASGTHPNVQTRAADTAGESAAQGVRGQALLCGPGHSLIFQTSSLKKTLEDQLPDLGMQLVDLTVPVRFRILASTPIKDSCGRSSNCFFQA
jgi:hypothetical protein